MTNHPNRNRVTASLLATIYRRFPTQEAAMTHLERIRWGKSPTCPYCFQVAISRRSETDRAGRWQCCSCGKSCSASVGTVFHNSHVDLRNWFFVIAAMLRSSDGVNVSQIARDLDMRRATVSDMVERLRPRIVAERKFFSALVKSRA